MRSRFMTTISDRRSAALRTAVVTVVSGSFLFAAAAVPAAAVPATGGPAPAAATAADVTERPDRYSASVAAAMQGHRVEVSGERTPFQLLFANPDGSFTLEASSGPERVEQADGTWTTIDTTLVADAGGAVSPKAAAADITLSGGEADPAGTATPVLAAVAMPGDKDSRNAAADSLAGVGDGTGAPVVDDVVGPEVSVSVGWDGDLPRPELDGAEARYPDVASGVDIRVRAVPRGVETFVDLKARPADLGAGGFVLRMPLSAKGLTVVEDPATGGLTIKDKDGQVLSKTPPARIWDADIDPVSADPRHGIVVDTDLVKTAAGLRLQVVVPQSFLDDPDVVYPVTIDPTSTLGASLDTYIEKGYNSTAFGSETDLKVGSYDAGVHVGRSYVAFHLSGVSGLIGSTTVIDSAKLKLWEWHAASCTASAMYIRRATTGVSETSSTWNNPPGQSSSYYTVTDAHRNDSSGACAEGWIGGSTGMTVTDVVSDWAAGTANYGFALTASETTSTGWKRFYSSEYATTARRPSLSITFHHIPDVAGTPSVSPVPNAAKWITTKTPTLKATVSDKDGGNVRAIHKVYSGSTLITSCTSGYVASGGSASCAVPTSPALSEGVTYTVRSYGNDGTNTSAAWSTGYAQFQIDTTLPGAPIVSSSTYPSDGLPHGDAGVPGIFNFSAPAGTSDVASYEYRTDEAPTTVLTWLPTAPAPTITPVDAGLRTVWVRSVDRAGNKSAETAYSFKVGAAAVIEPAAGARLASKTKIRVQVNDPALTKVVSVQYRRGPAGAPVVISAAYLTDSANNPFVPGTTLPNPSSSWYATWNALADLGSTGGLAEVSVTLSKTDGTGQLTTKWVPVVVDPNADGAASTTVGPGELNLLTGDYSISTTDVSEFGLSVTRASSSRIPDAGFIPQRERLTDVARTVTATTGFTAGGTGTTLTRNTALGHDGTDSLSIGPATGGTSYAAVAAAGYFTDAALTPSSYTPVAGDRYRVTGWFYIPSATGLSPSDAANGLRLAVVYTPPSQTQQVALSPKATVTDAWQQLSLDVTIPTGSTGIEVRAYNGFATAGKIVHVDDLSVRELWAPFGPQWSGMIDSDLSSDWSSLSVRADGNVDLIAGDGGRTRFNITGSSTAGSVKTTSFIGEPGTEDLVLTGTGPTTGTPTAYKVVDAGGGTTSFAALPGQIATFGVDQVIPAAGPEVTRYQWTRDTIGATVGVSKLWRVVNPAPTGVTGCAVTSGAPPRGCEVLEYVYAATTTATASTPGDIAGQVQAIKVWSWDGTAVTALDVARYTYDQYGRLVETWDPRTATPLKTVYTFDSATDPLARVRSAASPGDLPWTFTYAAVAPDTNPGRLLTVSRPSLVPGTLSTQGPATVSSILYTVPLTRAGGGPYDLDAVSATAWGQYDLPTDATAVFPPTQTPTTTVPGSADSVSPGSGGYGQATVHYLNANGLEVNAAAPAAGSLAAQGLIDTTEYDWRGNQTRTLDAAGRRLALSSSAADDTWLTDLGIKALPSSARAALLDTEVVYSADGVDVLEATGPLRAAKLGAAVADPDGAGGLDALPAGSDVVARPHTVNTYDQGKPDAAVYHLVTTRSVGAVLYGAGAPLGYPSDADVRTITMGYGVAIAGSASGWTFRAPTKVTVDAVAGGKNLSSLVKLDSEGRPVESRKVDSAGGDARTTLAVFYTADASASDARCRNKPEWAGQPCLTYAGSAVPAVGAATAPSGLPERYVSAYSRTGDAAVVSETANGVTRTTTTLYDAADRMTKVSITGTGTGVGTAVDDVYSEYDPATGDLTATYTKSGATETGRITRTYDALGRLVDYTDADGGLTHSVFDAQGRISQVTDSVGSTTTYTYDAAAEPRGFVTKINDSVAGDLTVAYGPDGQVSSETLPGGVTRTITYDASGTAVAQVYAHAQAPDGILFEDQIDESIHGQWLTHSTSLNAMTYAYDRLGRLTDVTDTHDGLCDTRGYTHDNRANRLTRTSTSGTLDEATSTCTAGAPVVENHTYDTADRLVDAGYTYDALGRTTVLPAGLTNTFRVNDLIDTQTVGTSRKSWTLDPGMRLRATHNEALLTSTWTDAGTKINHYDGDGDSPRWISEDTTNPTDVTRMVDGPAGSLVATTGKTGNVITQITDLHGDVVLEMTGAPNQLVTHKFDEFGVPQAIAGQATPSYTRYGWLGGAQRSADALGGVLLMGVRLYAPDLGRFLSVDPVEGGNASAYDYCNGDPVNCTDLDGRFGWGDLFNAVAQVAEVASWIPGPVGAAAAAVSAVSYAASGNRGKALEMAVTAAAQLVGAGAAVRVGFKIAKLAAKVGQRVFSAARKVMRVASKACAVGNSFAPGTEVLLADGSFRAIDAIGVGDLVMSADPISGVDRAEPVVDIVVGQGDRDLVQITSESGEVVTATANHPVWIEGNGWVPAGQIAPSAITRSFGSPRLSVSVTGPVRVPSQLVYNLNVALTHTYFVRLGTVAILVHNSNCHGNSLKYIGQTHTYKIVDDAGQVMKYGKGGRLTRGGTVSPRAARQVRRANRAVGYNKYSYEILGRHGGTRAALAEERSLVQSHRVVYGRASLPWNRERYM